MRKELVVPERLTLRPYQVEDCQRGAVGKHNAVFFGHEMALGKTVIAVETLLLRDSKRNLIVAPLNTHDTWQETILRQTGGEANVLVHPPGSSTSPEANLWWRAVRANTPGWYIIGWNAFTGKATKEQSEKYKKQCEEAKKNNEKKPRKKPNQPWWKTGHWDATILDECHRMANPKSMAYLTANTLDTEFKIAMSGTPARNKVEGFWAVMSWLWPHLYHNDIPQAQSYYQWVFKHLHTEKVAYGSGFKIIGEKPGHRIADQIPLYIRRTTEEVLKDLPKVITQVIEVPLLSGAQERAYRDLEEKAFTWLEGKPLGTRLDTIKFLRLRQIALGVPSITYTGEYDEDDCEIIEVDFKPDCKSNKIDVVKEILTDLPQEETVLIFTHSAKFAKAVVHQINKAKLGPAALHTGDVDQNTRNRTRKMFGTGGIRVLVAGIAATGEGTDGLQHRCSKEIWLSEHDDNVLNNQARARLRRPGQEDDHIQRWFVQSSGTVDQKRHLELNENSQNMRAAHAAPTSYLVEAPNVVTAF